MAIGPQGFIPDYAQQAAMQRQQPSRGQTIGRHLVGGSLAALQGGLGAYGARQGQLQQQAAQQPQASLPDQNKANLPQQSGQMQQPGGSPQPSSNMMLSNLLQQLTAQKADQLMGRRQMMLPQPDQLRQRAFQASNDQMSQQGPPQWQEGQPQFAFDQYTGPGGAVNALSALADLSTEALGETDEDLPWYKQLAHGGGKVLQGAAPLLGMLGPLGLLGGALSGAAGYGLQQI